MSLLMHNSWIIIQAEHTKEVEQRPTEACCRAANRLTWRVDPCDIRQNLLWSKVTLAARTRPLADGGSTYT